MSSPPPLGETQKYYYSYLFDLALHIFLYVNLKAEIAKVKNYFWQRYKQSTTERLNKVHFCGGKQLKGNIWGNMQARVMVLMYDTSSVGTLQMFEVLSKYLKMFSRYRVDTICDGK